MAISYTKTNWNNDADPPINAENLNKIENGIESCVNGVNSALPLSGGTLTGDLSIINYKKLKFSDNSYFQNQANTRTALYGDLKMENGNIILGIGLSINPPANTSVFNGIQIKGNVRLDDGLLYMNGKRIALVATPSADTDAANKKYVDDQIATVDTSTCVQKSGDTMTGTLNMGDNAITLGGHTIQNIPANNYLDVSGTVRFLSSTVYGGNLNITGKKITNLGTPTTGTDAANKQYVDSVASAAGSTYTVQVKSNHTNATVTYGWKIGKMIIFYGQFNDGLNNGANLVNVASADTISHGYIQSGDNVMAFGNIHDNYATFDEEVGATTCGSAFNGRNFVGVIWLT